jgi:RNA polymerase sigma factor (sigma-70 family)
MITPVMGGFTRQIDTLWNDGAIGTLDDGALLERFLRREDAADSAFEALVRRHGPMVFRACLAVLGDAHDAEDAAQATFIVLARKASTVRRVGSVSNWLFGTARHVAVRARRDMARRRRHERLYAEAILKPGNANAATSDQPECWADLYDELGRLPARYQIAIILCDLQGMTHQQAAGRLGCPPRTLETRLYRGRQRLRSRLLRRGFTTAAILVGTSRATDAISWADSGCHSAIARAATHQIGSPSLSTSAGIGSAEVAHLVKLGIRDLHMAKLMRIGAAGFLLGATAVSLWICALRGAGVRADDGPQVPASRVNQRQPIEARQPTGDGFEQAYALNDGELLRCIRPPATSVRTAHRRANDAPNQGDDVSFFYRWRDRFLREAYFMGGDTPRLGDVLFPILGAQRPEVEGDPALLNSPVVADFVIRERVSPERLVPPLQEILRRDFGLSVRMTFLTEKRDVIVVRGRYRFKRDPAQRAGADAATFGAGQLEIYAREFGDPRDPTRNLPGAGGFDSFLSVLGMHFGRRLVDETEAPPKEVLYWRIYPYVYPPRTPGAEDRRLELDHLAAQTGLTFREEQRDVRLLRVERDK